MFFHQSAAQGMKKRVSYTFYNANHTCVPVHKL